MLSERIGDDCVGLSNRWILDPKLAQDLVSLNLWAQATYAAEGFRWQGLYIISGHRSPSVQAVINPSVPRSLHTHCPSLAADLRVANVPASLTSDQVWLALGLQWEVMGNRWGGKFGTPDPNHFDLGRSPAQWEHT